MRTWPIPKLRERSPLEARIAALVARPWFWALLLIVIVAFPLGRSLARPLPQPPKMRLALPAYELSNLRGEKFGSKDLEGKVYVADFIFTSCPSVCPKLTKTMERIQNRTKNLGTSLQLVSFTVDPENDSPEKLAAFARHYHVNPTRWSFLTGSLASVEATVIKGFKISMGKEEVGEGLFSIFHGERLVLVDGDANIRGFYEADDDGVATLIRDADVLLNVRDWGPGAPLHVAHASASGPSGGPATSAFGPSGGPATSAFGPSGGPATSAFGPSGGPATGLRPQWRRTSPGPRAALQRRPSAPVAALQRRPSAPVAALQTLHPPRKSRRRARKSRRNEGETRTNSPRVPRKISPVVLTRPAKTGYTRDIVEDPGKTTE